MVWFFTFALPAAIAALFYAIMRWQDRGRARCYKGEARLTAGAIFAVGAAVATLNTLAYAGI